MSQLVSLVMSVLTIIGVAGMVSPEEPDALNQHNGPLVEKAHDAQTSDTDYRDREQSRLQTPRLQLQTDQAMQQSSKALEESIKQKGKND